MSIPTDAAWTWSYHKDERWEGVEDLREIHAKNKDGETVLCIGYSRIVMESGMSVMAGVNSDGERQFSCEYVPGEDVPADWVMFLTMVIQLAMRDVGREDIDDFIGHALRKVW